MLDEARMLRVLQRALPALADVPIRVTRCRVRPQSRRRGSRAGRSRVAWRVTVEGSRGSRWEHTVVGTAAVPPDFLGPEVMHLCRSAESDPATAPFRRLAAYVEELEIALLVLPVDPGLPALTAITGRERGRLLAPYIGANRGTVIRRADWALRRYVPSRRCELAMSVDVERNGTMDQRQVQVHVFADDRGDLHDRNLAAVWPVTRHAESLRVPEPLGYDADRRLLFTGSVGDRSASRWIRRLARDKPLPAGVDRLRVQGCVAVAARALVELQQADLAPSEECTFRGELAPLHRGIEMLGAAGPEIAADFGRLLEALGAQPIDEETLVPAHGRYGPDRLAGDERNLVIVDWERLCLASPALDAASFLARLRSGALSRPGAGEQVEHLASVFRREFLSRGPAVTEPELAAYESLMLARQSARLARRAGRRNAAAMRRVHRLIRAALARLEAGEPRAIAG